MVKTRLQTQVTICLNRYNFNYKQYVAVCILFALFIDDLIFLKSWLVIFCCVFSNASDMVVAIQIPGSNNQFDGVVNTLTGIAKHEGLKGLYRSGFSDSGSNF